jgi:hypothetical protein
VVLGGLGLPKDKEKKPKVLRGKPLTPKNVRKEKKRRSPKGRKAPNRRKIQTRRRALNREKIPKQKRRVLILLRSIVRRWK